MPSILETTHTIRVLAAGLQFPEGPAFDPSGNLWCVELQGGALVQWRDNQPERFPTGGGPNGIAMDAKGRIWFCDAVEQAIRRYSPESGQLETVLTHVDGQPLDKPNDLAFDSAGNLLFTCPGDSRWEPGGYVCLLRPDGLASKIATDLYFPNGLALPPAGRELVVAETYRHRLWRGEWDPVAGKWTNARPWVEVVGEDHPQDGMRGESLRATERYPKGLGPDGMAFDAASNLYVAVFGTGKIKVIRPDGVIFREILLPGKNPTNCAFDPAGKLGLVVTEAEKGQLLSIPVDAKGAPLYK